MRATIRWPPGQGFACQPGTPGGATTIWPPQAGRRLGLIGRVKNLNPKLQPPHVLVAVGFLLLLLTSLQGWGMVGIIAVAGEGHVPLLQELKRLHNLGLAGGFLAIAFGLTMIALRLDTTRTKTIYRVLLPSLLVAPVGFSDRVLSLVRGSIPLALQVGFYALQAVSALGITVSLIVMLIAILRHQRQAPDPSAEPTEPGQP